MLHLKLYLNHPACKSNVLLRPVVFGVCVCDQRGSAIFFVIVSSTVQFSGENYLHETCFDFPYNFHMELFPFQENSAFYKYSWFAQ